MFKVKYLLITILLHYLIPFLFVYNLLLSELRIKFFWELHKFRSADWGLITDLGPETLATPLSTHPQQQQEAKKSPNGQCPKGRIAASGWGTIHLRPFWQEAMWTIFGEILSLIQFLSVCLVLGTILYLFGNKNLIWANYLCCKWPNVEKIIHRSGNCRIDYIIKLLWPQSSQQNITLAKIVTYWNQTWILCCLQRLHWQVCPHQCQL